MKINYFNADHTHSLIDLPTRYSIEEVIKLLKGGSSYWINHNEIMKGRFAWGVGYGAFLYHTLMSGEWRSTSRIKKSIIGSEHMQKSTRRLLTATVCSGDRRQTIKMVPDSGRRCTPT